MMSEERDIIDRVFDVVASRKGGDPAASYVASLYAKGVKKISEKVGEEAVETIIAANAEGRDEVIAESADLLFHLMVLWAELGLTPDDIRAELARREGLSGHEEQNAAWNAFAAKADRMIMSLPTGQGILMR